jgi:hypothetical protein
MELKDLENLSGEELQRVLGVLARGKYELVRCVDADSPDTIARMIFSALLGTEYAEQKTPTLYKCRATFAGFDAQTNQPRSVVEELPDQLTLGDWLCELARWQARYVTVDGVVTPMDAMVTDQSPRPHIYAQSAPPGAN